MNTNRGRFDTAADHLRRAGEIHAGSGGTTSYRASLLAATAELAAWQGRVSAVRSAVDVALASVDADVPLDPALGWLAWHALRAEADAAELARARGDETSLREIDARVAQIAERMVGVRGQVATTDRRLAAVAGLCQAELGRVHGRPDPAGWARTAADWDGLGRPAPAAYARYRSAEAILGSHGERSAAATALRDAHVVADRLGAAPLREAIERLARHARIDLAAAPSGAAPGSSDPDGATDQLGLTDREAEVIRLVAAGQSNQQIADTLFITRKTASVHVSNILGKLGVANRVEAAAVAHRLGIAVEPGDR